MGRCHSKQPKKYMVDYRPYIPPPIETEKCTIEQKNKMAEAIKKNDILLVARLLTFTKPTENLGQKGSNFTCFHFAAKHNSNRVMALFISWLQKNYSSDRDHVKNVLNFQDHLKRTPAMICALYNSPESLYALLKTELVSATMLDQARKDLWMLCEEHSKPCHMMLKLSQNRKDFQDPVKIFHKLKKELFGEDDKVSKKLTRKNTQTEELLAFSNRKVGAHEESDKEQVSYECKGLFQNIDWDIWYTKEHWKSIDDWWIFDEFGDRLKVHDKEVLNHIPPDTRVYEAITGLLNEKVEVYEDPDFPHNDEAMGTMRLKNIVWCRPDVVFQVPFERLYLFDSLEVKNIKMGEKSTCFLLSALTSLVEYPERLIKIFVNKRVNSYGCYGIKMYVRGRPLEVIFDDFLPCKMTENTPVSVFSNPGGIELWLVLIEKAWAKLFGAYSAIEFAMSSEVWEYLFGIPTMIYETDETDEAELWQKILEADRSNFFVTASTRDNTKEKYGLLSTHSYTMIAAYQVGDHKVMKFRNNWDLFNRDRDYSDSSQLWTLHPDLLTEVAWSSTKDGIFYISLKDFKEHFNEVMIGHYYNNWHFSYVDCKSDNRHAEYFTFSIKEPTHVFLRVHQRNERLCDSGYAPVEFNVYLVDNNNFKLFIPLTGIKGNSDPHSFIGHFSVFPNKNGLMLLKPGDYVCRVKVFWKNHGMNPFTISAYSDLPIELEHTERLKNIRARIAVHMGMFSEVQRLDQGNSCVIARMWTDTEHLIYAENSGEMRWTLTITFPKQVNAKPFKPYRTSEDTIVMTLNPGMRNGTGNKIINRLLQTEVVPEFMSTWDLPEPEPERSTLERKGTQSFERKNTHFERKKSNVSFL